MQTKGARILSAVGFLLAVGGCSVTVDVYGVVGQESEVFTGTSIGYSNRTGTIELSNGKGVTCAGEFAYSGTRTGRGLLTCNDGAQAWIQFNALSRTTGYGFGTANDGRSVRFYYGLSSSEGAKYIGQQPVQTASAAGASPSGQQALRSTGTGFFITRHGHVLTAAHVIDKCKELTVARTGSAAVKATLVATDVQNDIAVLMAAPSQTIALFRGGRSLRQGEAVIAYGFPFFGRLSSGGSMTTGSVNALSGLHDDTRYVQISAAVQPGNSGGPLLDGSGLVVGIVTSGLDAVKVARTTGAVPQNVNFALKVDVARTFLETAGISVETAAPGRELSAPDIGERARAFSVLIECMG